MSASDPAPGLGVVLFDGDCAFCQRSIAILKKLDWLHRLHYQSAREVDHLPPCEEPLVQEKLIEEMHVVTPDRRRAYAGFRAFRWIAWRLPLTVLTAPLLYLPGVPWLGNKVYRWVAKHRFQLVPCNAGECKVPLKR
jgi:predicted DCC family thiol-disulfide oxidoreductase YuxK